MRRLTMLSLISLIVLSVFSTPSVLAESLHSTMAADELHFTILHTNDEHSAMVPFPLVDFDNEKPNPSLGGFARLAQAAKEIRAAKEAVNEPVLLLSAGDYVAGHPYSWLALEGKAPELSVMIKMGYDVVTIGNHEYDYGPDLLAEYYKSAGYPGANADTALVASNILPPPGHALEDVGINKTHVKVLEGGLKLGFFGLIGIDAVNVSPNATPVDFADQVETARAAVAELEKQDVDVIIAITHAGEDEDVDLAKAVPGIDVIVGGHSHTLLEEPIIEGETIIVQAGEYLKYMGCLELAYNTSTGKLRIRNADTEPYVIPLDDRFAQEPEIAELVDKCTAELNAMIAEMTDGRFADISETVVRSSFVVPNTPVLQETPFANFVTDAMRLVAEEVTGEKVHLACQANGTLRGSIVPGSMPWSEDQVCFYDLASLVGLGSGPDGTPGYPLVSAYLTGQELRRLFEVQVLLAELMGDTYFLQFSGARMTYDPNRAVLFTVPFLDLPIPTTMAVLSAELYAGEGTQDTEDYIKIAKNDQQLYHIVTDYYIASFLPMIGEMLPSLELVMKDEHGNPIVDLDDAIIYRNGHELKVWQAVVEYAASQPLGSDGNPRISPYYAATAGRLVTKHTVPLWIWLVLILAVVVALVVVIVQAARHRKRRRKLVA
jgi:5'-nucleotidase/UDP-sugar diphosphatase